MANLAGAFRCRARLDRARPQTQSELHAEENDFTNRILHG